MLAVMQQPSRSSSRGTIVFVLVAVVALGSTVTATGLGGGARKHLAASRAILRAECTGVGGANPCGPSRGAELVASSFQKEHFAAADAALRVGDRAMASWHLGRVLDGATALDRQHTMDAALVASLLVDKVAKRIDAEPSLLDQPALVATLRRTKLSSAKQPLTPERLQALARLSRVPSEMPIQSGGYAELKTAQAMDEVDLALRTMNSAIIAKDAAACEAAAESTRGLARTVTVGPGMCAYGSDIVASGERLADLRARADARAHTTRL